MHPAIAPLGRVWTDRFGQWADTPLICPPMDNLRGTQTRPWTALDGFGHGRVWTLPRSTLDEFSNSIAEILPGIENDLLYLLIISIYLNVYSS